MTTETSVLPTTYSIHNEKDVAPAPPAHVLGIEDIATSIPHILQTALEWKAQAAHGPLPQHMAGTVSALIFQNPSTRTRASLEAGIARLGGGSTTLESQTSQMGRGESIEDTVGALSRYADLLVVRAKSHADLESFAHHSKVPVVNALTDMQHPLQTLADLMTIAETCCADKTSVMNLTTSLEGRTLAWVGDGNNVCNSLILGALSCGMNVHVGTPKGYAPAANIQAQAHKIAAARGCDLQVTTDPSAAVADADVVSTDTWRSMGTEEEAVHRLVAFQGYTVDAALMDQAAPEAVFLHCMPGHWGEEATYEVAHGPQSRMFDQAENRMWTQMALLVELLDKSGHGAGH